MNELKNQKEKIQKMKIYFSAEFNFYKLTLNLLKILFINCKFLLFLVDLLNNGIFFLFIYLNQNKKTFIKLIIIINSLK